MNCAKFLKTLLITEHLQWPLLHLEIYYRYRILDEMASGWKTQNVSKIGQNKVFCSVFSGTLTEYKDRWAMVHE